MKKSLALLGAGAALAIAGTLAVRWYHNGHRHHEG